MAETVAPIDLRPGLKPIPHEDGPIPEITFVAPDQCDYYFDAISPYLYGIDACSRGTSDLTTLFDVLREGRAQLWVYSLEGEVIGAAVSEIISYPKLKALRFWAIGGDVRAMRKSHVQTDEYMRAEGCTKCQMLVPAWAEGFLKDMDMEPVQTIYERDLFQEGT